LPIPEAYRSGVDKELSVTGFTSPSESSEQQADFAKFWLKAEVNMKINKLNGRVMLCAVALGGMFASGAALALDAEAAKELARANNCFKCHSVDKKKDGPAYKEVAAKYKGKADAQSRLFTHLTTGEKAKFPDGHEEEHKVIKAKSPDETKNLVDWILSQ
jgi:cytochrome c